MSTRGCGDGRSDVILLHGLAGLFNSWDKTVDSMKGKFWVHELTLPDYCSTKTGFELDEYREYVLSVINTSNVKKAAIIGHSLGGQIALTVAATAPQVASCLVLVSTSGIQTNLDRAPPPVRRPFSEASRDQILSAIFVDPTVIPDDIRRRAYLYLSDRARFRGLVKTLRKAKAQALDPLLEKLRVPTLIVWGDNDRITPVEAGRELARKLGSASFVVIPNCGHAPQIEHPEIFNRLVIDFLKRQRL